MVNSTLEKEHDADPMPNASEAFYTNLFKQQHEKGVRMTNYEVDFLQDQTQWFAPYVEEVDGSEKWLGGMARAAAELNMSVQYCMSHPAAFLNAAMSLPAVTNGRASGDYADPVGNLLQYGTSAVFFSAVGIAPSKDNFWSTPNQPKPRSLQGGPPPCDGGNRNVTDNFLHALVATLSTGPVGFSDALGYTNATLVKSTCAKDGMLLKPSLPLAAIDRSFSIGSNESTVAPSVPAGSHVWTTHTSAAGQTWWFVLAISVEQPWELLRSDLYPVLPLSEQVVVYDYRDPAGTAKLIEANQTVLWEIQTPPAADGYHGFTYLVIASIIPTSGGWALLGET